MKMYSSKLQNTVNVGRRETAQGTLFSKPTTIVGDGKPEDAFVEGMTLPGKELDLAKAAKLVRSESVMNAKAELQDKKSVEVETEFGVWTATKKPAGVHHSEGIALSQKGGDLLKESVELIAYPVSPEENRLELTFERNNWAHDVRSEQLIIGLEGQIPDRRPEQMIGPDLELVQERVIDEISLTNYGEGGLPFIIADSTPETRRATSISSR